MVMHIENRGAETFGGGLPDWDPEDFAPELSPHMPALTDAPNTSGNGLLTLPPPELRDWQLLAQPGGDPTQAQPNWGEPPGHSVLLDLPPAAVSAPVTPPESSFASPGIAEQAVSGDWLEQREAALQALRADYSAAFQEAVILDRDIAHPPGSAGFSETAFAEGFLNRAAAGGNAAWQALAQLYDTSPQRLASQHPGLLRLALTDHPINAGPAPSGRAMGNAQQLGITDLVLADPLMREIAQSLGQTPAESRTALAHEQIRLYGAVRYEQLTQLQSGMQAVRDAYSGALAQAAQQVDGPGWIDVEVQRAVQTHWSAGDNDGVTTSFETVNERRFNPDAFTRHYIAQDGLPNRAFAALYGASTTQFSERTPSNNPNREPAPDGPPTIGRISFVNSAWHIDGVGASMGRDDLVALDLNHAPRLRNDAAVGFDFDVGWATTPDNIYRRANVLGQVVQVAAVVGVSYFTYGLASGWAGASAASGGLAFGATGAAVIGSAAAGAASSLVGGALSGDISFRSIVQGALSGALTAGLMSELGSLIAVRAAGDIGAIALRSTVQGGIQALLGGEFQDGALAGFASGLAISVGQALEGSLAQAILDDAIPADQIGAARNFTRALTSAIRAAGNPDDPLSAFAGGFLSEVLQGSGLVEAVVGGAAPAPAAESEGPSTFGAATLQAVALSEQLQREGYAPDAAAAEAMRWVGAELVRPAPDMSASAPHDVQTVVIRGTPFPRDRLGNRYEQAPNGQTTVHLADGGMLLMGGTVTLPMSDGFVLPSWTVLQQIGQAVLRAPAIAVGAVLAGIPSNAGQDAQVWQMGANERLQWGPGDLWATMYEQTVAGEWRPVMSVQDQADGGQALLPVRYWVEPNATGFFTLEERIIRLIQQPITTPAQSPQGPNLLPLPVTNQRPDAVPPTTSTGPAGPTVETLPAAAQPTPEDLIIESRERAQAAWLADPRLRDPNSMVGTSEGGPGTWGYSPTRTGGEAYQEQITGVPRGVEYQVNGVWFDGYDPSTGVLLDAKDWIDYPPRSADFWVRDTVSEARRQLDAGQGTESRIEWRVATQHAANQLRQVFAREAALQQIRIVVVPKE